MATKETKEIPLKDERDSNGIRVGSWEVGLFGCCSSIVPNCCMASCFPCISLAQIMSRIGMCKFSHALLGFLFLYATLIASVSISGWLIADAVGDVVTKTSKDEDYDPTADDAVVLKASAATYAYQLACGASATLSLVYFVLVFHLRSSVRERFQVPGNLIFDFFATAWCSCCTIAQMASHVKSYTPRSCSFGPPDTLPAYQ